MGRIGSVVVKGFLTCRVHLSMRLYRLVTPLLGRVNLFQLYEEEPGSETVLTLERKVVGTPHTVCAGKVLYKPRTLCAQEKCYTSITSKSVQRWMISRKSTILGSLVIVCKDG